MSEFITNLSIQELKDWVSHYEDEISLLQDEIKKRVA